MYNFKLKIRSFPKKGKLQKSSIIKLKDVYKTGLQFKKKFKSQEGELSILIAFSLLNTIIEAIYPYLSQLSQNFMSKV